MRYRSLEKRRRRPRDLLYTACGLVRLAPSELVTWTKQPNHQVKFTLYDNSDGVENLSINGYYTPYVAKASDGRLFFATPAGLALIILVALLRINFRLRFTSNN